MFLLPKLLNCLIFTCYLREQEELQNTKKILPISSYVADFFLPNSGSLLSGGTRRLALLLERCEVMKLVNI